MIKKIKLSALPVYQCLTASAIAVVVSLGSMTSAHAVNGCKLDFRVKNLKPTAIKVLKFEYDDNTTGSGYSEAISNRKLVGNMVGYETWENQKVEKIAEGNPVARIRIQYKDDTTGSGSSWSNAIWTNWYSHSGDCRDNRSYSHIID